MRNKSILHITIIFLFTCFTVGIAQDEIIIDGKYYPPLAESRNVTIMLLGGSEGGIPKYDVEAFTKIGYPCFQLGYFGTKNTPEVLEMVPLEYFEEAIKLFRSQPEIGDKKIVLFGGSKGGELALLLASRYKQIEGVIARSPSSVVFQGIYGPLRTSSWSFKGKPISFVPYAPYDYSKKNAKLVEMYDLSLKQIEAAEKATIKVENINGPILLLTGKEDTVWPSSKMGELIIERLEDNNFPYMYEHIAYDNAGHALNEKAVMGGTEEGNKQARIDYEQQILDFLGRLSTEEQ